MEVGSAADWLSAFANLAIAGAAIAAAWQAAKGLQAWRKELVGKRRIELAEDVLADFYEAVDRIRRVRLGGASAALEYLNRPGRDEEPDTLRHIKDQYYPMIDRLDEESEFFARLMARKYRVIATFGRDAARPYAEINEIRNEIRLAAFRLMREHRGELTEIMSKKIDRDERIVWEDINGPDKIMERMNSVLNEVDEGFRKEIILGEESRK